MEHPPSQGRGGAQKDKAKVLGQGQGEGGSAQPAQKPVVVLCIGMAGSGKTTFVERLNSHLAMRQKSSYVINLDPAVSQLPYSANIDIRETVNYKEVMKHYQLGPNGAIVTSLNLFATKFDQVLHFLDKRSSQFSHVVVDTPGQIEVFTWSASGTIVTETLGASYPTVVAYVIDTPRTTDPATFMSNMLYACSIMYKTKLPFILVFNKTDVVSHEFAVEWMQDYEAFQLSIEQEKTYMSTLIHSMSLVLDEFYKNLKYVGVSSATGAGFDDFLKVLAEAKVEYETDYVPEIEKMMHLKREKEAQRVAKEKAKLEKDLKAAGKSGSADLSESDEERGEPEDED